MKWGVDAGDDTPRETAECVFRLPDLGEGLVSAEIIEWLVEVGAQVEVDQLVVTVETEKATTELPSPFSGRVTRLHGGTGDRVAVGTPLVTFEVEAGADPSASSSTHLVGRRPDRATATDGPERSAIVSLPPKTGRGNMVAAPAVRRLARELGVELGDVTGTGNGGAITRDDVHAANRRTVEQGET